MHHRMHSWRTCASPSGTLADVLPSSGHQLSELLSKMLVGRRPDRDTPCAFRNVVKNCSLPGFRRCPQEAGDARRIGHRHRAAPQVGTFRVKARGLAVYRKHGLGVPPLLGAALGPVAQHALALVALEPWLGRPPIGARSTNRRGCGSVRSSAPSPAACALPGSCPTSRATLPPACHLPPPLVHEARVRPRSTQQRAGQIGIPRLLAYSRQPTTVRRGPR
jgi:hypothetical protein